MYRGKSKYQIVSVFNFKYVFLTSAVVGDEWSASRICRFIPRSHSITGCMDPRSSLDDIETGRSLILSVLELRYFCCSFTDCATAVLTERERKPRSETLQAVFLSRLKSKVWQFDAGQVPTSSLSASSVRTQFQLLIP
jgi:hypothetical protein